MRVCPKCGSPNIVYESYPTVVYTYLGNLSMDKENIIYETFDNSFEYADEATAVLDKYSCANCLHEYGAETLTELYYEMKEKEKT